MSFYVTTPIYYVNAAPHLGHAYTAIAADVLARHMRQRGENVFFLTGTDEHGEPVALAAEARGMTPQALVDENAPRFRELMPQLNVSNDFFVRTSDSEHKLCVQEILTAVKERGHVHLGLYEGWYCPRCADFKTESEIAEGNTCPLHKIPLERKSEQNWFFKLSDFQQQLEELFDGNPDFVRPKHRFNEARAFLAQGLQDVSLSRSELSWGVEVPWDPEHVFYVWFDALLNYVTALSYARPGKDLTEEFWPPQVQLIGKDILKFHTIYWPALLMAAGLPLPEHVVVHGFLLMRDADGTEHKMSKSLGNVLDPFQIIDEFGADALRYYCLREVRFGQDGAVSTAGFAARYESELANELGNLASRTTAMVERYREGAVPQVAPDPAIAAEIDPLVGQVCEQIDASELTVALDTAWQAVRRLNRYVEEQAPWALAKDEAQAGQLDVVLATLTDGLRVIGLLLHPWLPATVDTLFAALGVDDLSLDGATLRTGAVTHVTKIAPLFPKPE